MQPPDISAMNLDQMLDCEWLSVNHLGGYASSTLCGLNTRKYHGLLVAAMAPPVRRMVLLSQLDEIVHDKTGSYPLSCNEYPGTISPRGFQALRAFNPDPFPRWAYQSDGFTIEKSLRLADGENTVCISYTLLAGDRSVELEIRPLLALRGIHELMYQWNSKLTAESLKSGRVRISATTRTPEIFFAHDGHFHGDSFWYLNTIHRQEQYRGYAGLEDLWNPGKFVWTLHPGQTIHLVCSADPVELDPVLDRLEKSADRLLRKTQLVDAGPADRRLKGLIHTAGEFLTFTSADNSRSEMERAESFPAQIVHVIPQFPWSTPNTRAALAGFSGLFLSTENHETGREFLRFLSAQLHEGLIPSEFPEAGGKPISNAADVSLWFINAIWEYFDATGDLQTTGALLGSAEAIIAAYRRGAELGIACDSDGLLASRAPMLPTSWMDARVGDWVVTPRSGRPVELNALWYNAIRITSELCRKLERRFAADELDQFTARVSESFNRRFWNAHLNCCFDVVDDHGSDPAIRPNQIFSLSLPFPVLAKEYWQPMLQTVLSELLTPMGLRTLSPRDPAYQGKFTGNIVSRERAQHQGSAYPWLLGPLARAYVRTNGLTSDVILQIKHWIEGPLAYAEGNGLGRICELFDGTAPHSHGGAVTSSLSVSEILRCQSELILGISSRRQKVAPIVFSEIMPSVSIPQKTGNS